MCPVFGSVRWHSLRAGLGFALGEVPGQACFIVRRTRYSSSSAPDRVDALNWERRRWHGLLRPRRSILPWRVGKRGLRQVHSLHIVLRFRITPTP
jgi:hypothetical protein